LKKAATLAGDCQEIFMAAIPALQPGKTFVRGAVVQITENDLLEIGAVESLLTFKMFLVDLNQVSK
jgi:hypothetical protein